MARLIDHKTGRQRRLCQHSKTGGAGAANAVWKGVGWERDTGRGVVVVVVVG